MTFAAPRTQLLSYRGMDCVRTLGITTSEKVGGALSFFGLLALIATGAIGLRRRKPS